MVLPTMDSALDKASSEEHNGKSKDVATLPECSGNSKLDDGTTAPARDLDDCTEPPFTLKTFFRFAGPGIIMSTAFIDPGDLEGGMAAAAWYVYSLLWVYLWSSVMGYTMQMMAAKLGVASGKDLARHCREQYPFLANLALWLLMEVAVIGVEIQYIIGAAQGLQLLCGPIDTSDNIPLWAAILVCATLAYLTLALDIFGIKAVEVTFMVMIGIMCVTFIVLAGVAGAPGTQILKGMTIPKVPEGSALVVGGIVGGALSPYNVFFYSWLVIKRSEMPMETRGEKRAAMKCYCLEAFIALFLALLMNICIVATFIVTFDYGTDDYAQQNAGLINAAYTLRETFGTAFQYIWAIGLFATGISSAAGSVYAVQAIMSGFMDIKLPIWQRALITRILAIIPAVALAATQTSENEVDTLNLWINLLQTIALPFALLPLLHMATNKAIMGIHWTNSLLWLLAGSVITAFSLFISIYCTIKSVPAPTNGGVKFIAIFAIIVYCASAVYCAIGPDRCSRWWSIFWARYGCCCKTVPFDSMTSIEMPLEPTATLSIAQDYKLDAAAAPHAASMGRAASAARAE